MDSVNEIDIYINETEETLVNSITYNTIDSNLPNNINYEDYFIKFNYGIYLICFILIVFNITNYLIKTVGRK